MNLGANGWMRACWPAMAAAAMVLCGCVQNAPYRTTAGICGTANCETGSIERHTTQADPSIEYLLGIVEFDDQGAKHIPAQMDALFDRLKAESKDQDLCIVVFVHGWEHNGKYDDTNVEDFRKLLESLALTENQLQPGMRNQPRKAVGIYASWRGQSLDAGWLSTVTFWNRKDAAERVAKGSIRELLGRARALRDTLDRTTWEGTLLPAGASPPAGQNLRSTRLLTIGHSFGGLIVYSALAQYYTDRAAAAAMAVELGNAKEEDKMIPAYGDLVVIVNPAVEATSWQPIQEIVKDRRGAQFARWQKPVFVEVTSTADLATGIAFPLGRSFSTVSENFVDGKERREAQIAVGHYEPFVTHDLTKPQAAGVPSPSNGTPARRLVLAECDAQARFDADWRRDGYLLPGWTRQYLGGATLSHRANAFDPNNPFWIVRTDKSLIAGHSDIHEPAFVDFVRELYEDLQLDASTCAAIGQPALSGATSRVSASPAARRP